MEAKDYRMEQQWNYFKIGLSSFQKKFTGKLGFTNVTYFNANQAKTWECYQIKKLLIVFLNACFDVIINLEKPKISYEKEK